MRAQTVSLITLLTCVVILNAAWGQTPSPLPLAKPSTAQPQVPHPIHLTTSDDNEFVPLSTGKSPLDKAAVKAREERDAEAYRIVLDGEASFKAGKIQEAIASYNDALAINPTDEIAYQHLAEADVACGKLDEARQNFRKILVDGIVVEGGGATFRNSPGGNQDAWAEYALVLLKTKHEAEALSAYNKAAFIADYERDQHDQNKLIPHIPVLFPEVVLKDASPGQVAYTPERLQALADVVLTWTQKGFWSYKEIKAHAEEAVKLYPDSAVVQYYVGDALSGSYCAIIDSPVKDKPAAEVAYQEDKKGEAAAYKKAAETGDDRTVAAAKNRLTTLR